MEVTINASPPGLNLGQLLSEVQAQYPQIESLAREANGTLHVQFRAGVTPPQGAAARFSQYIASHQPRAQADPDADVLTAIQAAGSLPEVKAALVAWIRSTKGRS